MANFKAAEVVLEDFGWHQKKKLFKDVNHYVWDDPCLFKVGAYNLIRCCVTRDEAKNILSLSQFIIFTIWRSFQWRKNNN